MKKKSFLVVLTLLFLLISVVGICFSLTTATNAASITYETADVISIGDIASKKSISLKEPTKYYYSKSATRGSLIFKFDLENNAWNSNSSFQVYFVVDDGRSDPWWNDVNMYWFRNDLTVLRQETDTGTHTFGDLTKDPISSENHSIELGRLAIKSGRSYTGQYYVYIKVDGVEVASATNTYDYSQFTNCIFITGNANNENKLVDPNFVDFTYETADEISVSDLKIGGKSVGNRIKTQSNTTFTYDKTTKYGSIIFKFKYKNPSWTVDADGSQFHFYETYQENGMFWIRPDRVRICRLINGKADYIVGDPITAGTHDIELGRLAVMQGEKFTGKYYFYINIDGTLWLDVTIEVDAKLVDNNNMFITSTLKNSLLDTEWNGNKVTFVSNKQQINQIVTTEDYITKPEQDPFVEGKTFIGWFDELGKEWDFENDMVSGDMTLTAGFKDATIDYDDLTYFDDSTYTPVLRFFVTSDCHITTSLSNKNTRLANAFDVAYNYAKDSSKYNNLDAALFVGDVSDDGSIVALTNFKNTVENNIKEGTQAIISMGNHDFRGNDGDPEAIFKSLFKDTDFHVVINGYHFIALSPDINRGENFSEKKVKWLEAELEKAATADPDKPIFLMQHEGIMGTVYGSDAWGVSELTDVVCKYPQVVDFSGHSHYPLSDPRSIWQGTFTALGTSTLNYYEVGINGYKNGGVYPSDKTGGWAGAYSDASSRGEFQIVEIDENNAIRIICYDLDNNREITRYYIRNVMDERKTTYSHYERAKSSEKPVFTQGTELKATVNENAITLEFDQAKCKDTVESYRIELYKGSKLVDTYYALSDYFFYPIPEKIKYTIRFLQDNTEYDIKVYAVNVWNDVCEEPIATTVTTGYAPVYEDVIDEITLSDLYSSNSKTKLTTETTNSYLPVYFKKSENNVYGSFKLRMQLLYIAEDFQVGFNEEFANDDLVWINQENNNVWFIKDGFKSSKPVEPGLHIVEYGRYHITEGAHRGYTAFYVKIDEELIYTCESERAFTDNGCLILNFRGCYAAGSRYYDIDYDVPMEETPTFTDCTDITITEQFTDWTKLGGEVTFASLSPTLEFYLKDASGRVSENRVFEGDFVLGDKGSFYRYQVKTNMFTKTASATGSERITAICCTTPNWQIAELVTRVYGKEVLCDYDVINVLDIQAPDNNGIISNVDVETKYNFVGTSPTYSTVFKYYIVTDELDANSEFRTQVGTIWKYTNTLWLQPGDWSGIYFSWDYSTRPADKYSVNFKSHNIYEIECATIYVQEGEWKGWKYTYLKLDGELLTGFYVPGDECVSTDYTVTLKIRGGYKIADISLGRTIKYMVDGKEFDSKFAISGLKTTAPTNPTKEGAFFNGWYTAPVGGERVDFNKVFTSTDETVTYYARFADTSYNVNFYSEGSLIDTVQVGKDGMVLRPADPTKTGDVRYEFIKWVIKGTTQEYDFTSPVVKDIDLEAYFEEYKYKIVYLVDGKEYTTRYYTESNKTVIIDGEPAVPTLKGAVGHWVYSADKDKSDIYAKVVYNGVETETTRGIVLDKFDGIDVDIANDLTRFYLNIVDPEKQAKWLEGYPVYGGNERQDLTFSWTDNFNNRSYLVYFADNKTFENAFIVETSKRSLDYVGIFTPGKTYYWKVLGVDTETCSETDSFTVIDTPVRWISAGTVYNMRDIGGWTTTDGKTIEYEKIYRGGQLSIDIPTEVSYMNDYSYKVFDYLGIKTEIELRGDSTHTNNQFNDLEKLIRVNGTGYTSFFKLNDGHKADYRNVFAALADESNYPFYFHCSWGADRTGGLGFLINGVLGVPFEQLAMDYELTSLSHSGARGRYSYENGEFYNMYLKFMSDYSNGGTLQEAINNYLVNYIGVPQTDIDALKSIMLTTRTSTLVSHTVTYMVEGEIYQQVKVFDGGLANSVAPVYFDKSLDYWSLNGERFDMNTKVTTDLVLVAVFDESEQYEEYDVITVRDIGLEEGHVPTAHDPYAYEGSVSNGSVIFEFDYKIDVNDGAFDDGVHVEIGPHIWTWKAHVWIASSSTVHVFTNGETPPTASIPYEFEIGKTYRISIGVLLPLKGANAGKKMLMLMIDGKILGTYETKADLSNRFINLAGTEGKMYSTDNKKEIQFVVGDTVLETKSVTRGELLPTVTEPTSEGKVFLGWFDELGNAWNFNTDKVLKDMKLFAKFGDKTVNALVLDENGMEIQKDYKVKVGLKVSEIALPLVNDDRLQFDGWYNGNTKLNDSDVITENMNLICKFKLAQQEQSETSSEISKPKKKGCSTNSLADLTMVSALIIVAGLFVKRKDL